MWVELKVNFTQEYHVTFPTSQRLDKLRELQAELTSRVDGACLCDLICEGRLREIRGRRHSAPGQMRRVWDWKGICSPEHMGPPQEILIFQLRLAVNSTLNQSTF